ncbi:MAG TPA: hypothetical protein VHT05_07885 [Candidatus Elarobacter sp.]|jgi:hypothetical protein|nr:hypothetical protein [Candidatus Elarobacter sp.]
MRNPFGPGAFAVLFALAAAALPSQAAVQDDVRTATIDALTANPNPDAPVPVVTVARSAVHISYVVVAGRWGFTSWKIVGGAGGDMVLMKTDKVWHEFGRGSPHMSAHVLQRFGVPAPLILTFANGACPIPAQSVAMGYTVGSVSVRRYSGAGKQIDKKIACS